MSNYFEGEVLESAKRAVKDIKIKAWEELKVWFVPFWCEDHGVLKIVNDVLTGSILLCVYAGSRVFIYAGLLWTLYHHRYSNIYGTT